MSEKEAEKRIFDHLLFIIHCLDSEAFLSTEDSLYKGKIFQINCRQSNLLIGQNGKTLECLEFLINNIVYNDPSFPKDFRFSLDVNNYKKLKENKIKENLKKAILVLMENKKPLLLQYMTSSERKFIHTYIQAQYPEVSTMSRNVEGQRRIVLSLK